MKTTLEGGAFGERALLDDLIGECNTFEGGTVLECVMANSVEVFVADDALEGGAAGQRHLFNDFELIGESDTREGAAKLE